MLTPGASPMHHFGAEVRLAREAAGMSQSELGALVPCDKATAGGCSNCRDAGRLRGQL